METFDFAAGLHPERHPESGGDLLGNAGTLTFICIQIDFGKVVHYLITLR
jgi:hypothetical protein